MTNLSIFELCALVALFGAIIVGIGLYIARNENYDQCDCPGYSICEKWCDAKQKFYEENFKNPEQCKHTDTLTQLLESSATCETTIEVCADCGEPVSEPKTDCI